MNLEPLLIFNVAGIRSAQLLGPWARPWTLHCSRGVVSLLDKSVSWITNDYLFEIMLVLSALSQLPVPLERYTSPPEDSLALLRLYFRALVTGKLRHAWCPVLYMVALAHLNAFIFAQEPSLQVTVQAVMCSVTLYHSGTAYWTVVDGTGTSEVKCVSQPNYCSAYWALLHILTPISSYFKVNVFMNLFHGLSRR